MYTYTKPRKWTKENIEELVKLHDAGLTRKEIAEKLGRTEVAIGIKIKRLKKKNGKYNENHIKEKIKINKSFEEAIKPNCLLNVYAGNERYYKCKNIIRNDKNKIFKTDYHQDALKLLCKFYSENKKIDLIDLDPFGSAYECFDLAIKIAKKGIAITIGELGHKRFKRLDFVRNRYNINSLEEFTIDNIIKEIQKIGIQNKKELIIWQKKEWKNIGRVWFMIKPYKITEQWEKGSENE